MDTLSLDQLRNALVGRYAAIRRVTRLEPIGEKVFPPTYEGGEYAVEKRKRTIDDKVVEYETVLLDSVQSQANRMEMALLHAYDAGRIQMPLAWVDFASGGDDPILAEVGRVTALEAPHRIYDAIFRDSMLDGQDFRDSPRGRALDMAKTTNATPLLELCPTALLFGFWDSTGPRGGLGAKLQRALVSEIVGYGSVAGKRASSRIDPLQIENNVEIFERAGGGWTMSLDDAVKDKKGEPVKLRPSEVNHGNITPSFRNQDGNLNHGGVTVEYAEQNTVLSLAALRRLRFPIDGKADPSRDLAGQTLIAALGVAAMTLLDEDGYDLRSRCLLDGKPGQIEFIGRGESVSVGLDWTAAQDLLAEAARAAVAMGLPWPTEPLKLQPSEKLARLVVESRRRSIRRRSMSESVED
jgi:CRISPR-associated protein Csb1